MINCIEIFPVSIIVKVRHKITGEATRWFSSWLHSTHQEFKTDRRQKRIFFLLLSSSRRLVKVAVERQDKFFISSLYEFISYFIFWKLQMQSSFRRWDKSPTTKLLKNIPQLNGQTGSQPKELKGSVKYISKVLSEFIRCYEIQSFFPNWLKKNNIF